MLWLILTLCKRMLLLRCPRCGRSKIFKRWFTTFDRCPYCSWHFDREEGFWTGAVGINLSFIVLLVTAVVIPLAALQAPLLLLYGIGIPCMVVLSLLSYRHSKSLWLLLDLIFNPVDVWY